jgi:hypothetical protein
MAKLITSQNLDPVPLCVLTLTLSHEALGPIRPSIFKGLQLVAKKCKKFATKCNSRFYLEKVWIPLY